MQEDIKRADVIFSGPLVAVTGPGWNAELKRTQQVGGALEASFEVKTVWKGNPARTLALSTPGIGPECLNFPFIPVLGTEYLVLARRNRDGTFGETSCGYSGPLNVSKNVLKVLGTPSRKHTIESRII